MFGHAYSSASHLEVLSNFSFCCRSRTFQYGLKYYAMNAALLALIIALQANINLKSWHPVFVVGAAHHLSAFWEAAQLLMAAAGLSAACQHCTVCQAA